ncbi:MAG: hypothetical protein OCD01_19540 [Fibrobacterales bacterium]
MRIYLFLLLIGHGLASAENLKFCALAGYYSGQENTFMVGMANTYSGSSGGWSPTCMGLFKQGWQFGSNLNPDKKMDAFEKEVFDNSILFDAKVYNAMKDLIGPVPEIK